MICAVKANEEFVVNAYEKDADAHGLRSNCQMYIQEVKAVLMKGNLYPTWIICNKNMQSKKFLLQKGLGFGDLFFLLQCKTQICSPVAFRSSEVIGTHACHLKFEDLNQVF